MKKKRILFVCKHNRFRSKVAEGFFKKYNRNKFYEGYSAGLLPGEYPLDGAQIKIAKNFGINLKGKPKPATMDLLKKIDIVVIVADNVPPEVLSNKKYGREEIVWKIRDVYTNNYDDIKKTISQIEKKVIEFIENLKSKKYDYFLDDQQSKRFD